MEGRKADHQQRLSLVSRTRIRPQIDSMKSHLNCSTREWFCHTSGPAAGLPRLSSVNTTLVLGTPSAYATWVSDLPPSKLAMDSTNPTCGCGNPIHPERYALGFKICLACGEAAAQRRKPFGYVSYGHKTAGAIIVTTKAGFENYKKVSSRMAKGSNMGFASRVGTSFAPA